MCLLLLLRGRCRADTGTRLQSVLVVVAAKDSAALFLGTDLAASDPFVFNDFVQCSSLLWIYLEHPADDVSALSWEEA